MADDWVKRVMVVIGLARCAMRWGDNCYENANRLWMREAVGQGTVFRKETFQMRREGAYIRSMYGNISGYEPREKPPTRGCRVLGIGFFRQEAAINGNATQSGLLVVPSFLFFFVL